MIVEEVAEMFIHYELPNPIVNKYYQMWITDGHFVDSVCTNSAKRVKSKNKFYFGGRSFVSNLATPQEKNRPCLQFGNIAISGQ
jgi:type IV secretory pathway VirB3-like protein